MQLPHSVEPFSDNGSDVHVLNIGFRVLENAILFGHCRLGDPRHERHLFLQIFLVFLGLGLFLGSDFVPRDLFLLMLFAG